MTTLALSNQRKTWIVQHWTVPSSNVWFFLIASQKYGQTNLQSRFAVWALDYGIFRMTLQNRYHPINIKISWQDQYVGNITIEYIPQDLPLAIGSDRTSILLSANSSRVVNSLLSNTTSETGYLTFFPETDESYDVFFKYSGRSLASGRVLATIVSALRICADEGADSRSPSLEVSGWEDCELLIKSEFDKYGNALLRYRQAVVMLRKLAFQMVQRNKFGEMAFVLEVNGIKTAHGEFRKKLRKTSSRV